MIAALRRARVLPLMIWLAAFPLLMLGFALWERHDQNHAATTAVRAFDARPAKVLWSLTPRSASGYRLKYRKVACVSSAGTRRLVHLRKARPSERGWLQGWSATRVEVPRAAAAPSDYLGRC